MNNQKARPQTARCPKCGDATWIGPRWFEAVGYYLECLTYECATCRYIQRTPTLDAKETSNE